MFTRVWIKFLRRNTKLLKIPVTMRKKMLFLLYIAIIGLSLILFRHPRGRTKFVLKKRDELNPSYFKIDELNPNYVRSFPQIIKPKTCRGKEMLKLLLDVWHNDDDKLFLMDPVILKEYEGNKSESQICGVLSRTWKHTLTFGVIGNVSRSMSTVFNRLRIYNIDVVNFSDEFPNQIGKTKHNITSHVLLKVMKYPDITIHVVILYEIAAGFLWHSKLLDSYVGLSIGTNAGMYKKFDIEVAVIDGLSLYIPEQAKMFPDLVTQSKYIDCNQTRANIYFKSHPPDTSSRAMAFKKNAIQLIARAKSVFDKLDMRYWLCSGTLLGWYRQCDIISHTTDVDFGMWIKDFHPQLVTEMRKAKLPLKHLFGRINDSFELSFQAYGVKLDIFFFYEEADYVWNGGVIGSTGEKFKYAFPKFELCWATLLGLPVRVPCPTLPYIEADYGKDWFTPIKKWDWSRSPNNGQKNGFWPKDQWKDVIRVFF